MSDDHNADLAEIKASLRRISLKLHKMPTKFEWVAILFAAGVICALLIGLAA